MNDDLIKRSDAIKDLCDISNNSDMPNDWHRGMSVAISALYRVPPVPPADRPQGEWKRRLVDNGFNADWVCSECGYRVKTDFVSFNFCPNCGADMRGEDDE